MNIWSCVILQQLVTYLASFRSRESKNTLVHLHLPPYEPNKTHHSPVSIIIISSCMKSWTIQIYQLVMQEIKKG